MKILFCNIAWMEWYKGALPYDMPVNGGAYIKENRDGADCDNFWVVENFEPYRINKDTVIPEGKIMMGYVAMGSTPKGDFRQIKLERIQGCEACKDVDSILAMLSGIDSLIIPLINLISICKFNMGDFLKEHKVGEKIKVLKY